MNTMRSMLAIIAAAFITMGAGCALTVTQPNTTTPSQQETTQTDVMEKKTESDVMMKKDEPAGESIPTPVPGTYTTYSPERVTAEFAAGKKVVLFFHAPWCPFCRAADTAFTSRASEIPSGVTILKTDYDSNTALKQKYGVAYQHSFVQIDADGNEITQWSGGDIENVRKYVK